MTSPLIDDMEWGQITTVVGNFKDAKLWHPSFPRYPAS